MELSQCELESIQDKPPVILGRLLTYTSGSQQSVDKELRTVVCSPACHVIEKSIAVQVVVENVFAFSP
jgi:hypothetical protein